MNGLPYYKAYPRDFIEGTIGMSFELKGAYRLILDLIYMQGGRLPDDARYISGLLGCTLRKWNSLREELLALGKIVVNGGFLTNYRAEKELETLGKLQDKQRENASGPRKNKGLRKPRLGHTEPDTDTSSLRSDERAKRGTRLPDDWHPSEVEIAYAVEQGIPAGEVPRHAIEFRNYWTTLPGAKARKLDWSKTWQNRVLQIVAYRAKARASPNRQQPYGWLDAGCDVLTESHSGGVSREPDFNSDPFAEPSRSDLAGNGFDHSTSAQQGRSSGAQVLDLVPMRSVVR